jgi:hypothetical protein
MGEGGRRIKGFKIEDQNFKKFFGISAFYVVCFCTNSSDLKITFANYTHQPSTPAPFLKFYVTHFPPGLLTRLMHACAFNSNFEEILATHC